MILRPHQEDLLLRTAFALRDHRAVVLQAPTGTGKTRLAVEMIQRRLAKRPESRVWFLADRDFLITDTSERLRDAGLDHGVIREGRVPAETHRVWVSSIQTLRLHPDVWRDAMPDFVILDECRNAASATVRALIETHPSVYFLGLDATPMRADGQPLCTAGFRALVQGPQPDWLVSKGWLAPMQMIAPWVPVNGIAVAPCIAFQRYLMDRRTLVFASSRAHGKQMSAWFEKSGISALYIDGTAGSRQRKEAKVALVERKVQALISVDLFLVGWDCPECDGLLFARKMGTVAAWLQALGRGSRIHPGKADCLAVDLCGSWIELGLRDDPRTWSIDGEAVSPAGGKLPPAQRCKVCGAIFPPATVCPRCGAANEAIEKLPRILNRATKLALVSGLPIAERDRRYLNSLLRVAASRVMPNASTARQEVWAVERFKTTRGREPEVRT